MNILKNYPYAKRYYLTHPWKIVSQTFRNIKFAWQRITKGYCEYDYWDIDCYLLKLLPELFDDFRKNLHGYPCSFTEEEWDNFLLKEVIEPLRNARDDQNVEINEFEEKVNDYFKDKPLTDMNCPQELWDNYMARENEITNWRDKQMRRGFVAIITEFWSFWDQEALCQILKKEFRN